jgi:hypothetical protein
MKGSTKRCGPAPTSKISKTKDVTLKGPEAGSPGSVAKSPMLGGSLPKIPRQDASENIDYNKKKSFSSPSYDKPTPRISQGKKSK